MCVCVREREKESERERGRASKGQSHEPLYKVQSERESERARERDRDRDRERDRERERASCGATRHYTRYRESERESERVISRNIILLHDLRVKQILTREMSQSVGNWSSCQVDFVFLYHKTLSARNVAFEIPTRDLAWAVAGGKQLKRFQRRWPEKWLKSRPGSGRVCRMCTENGHTVTTDGRRAVGAAHMSLRYCLP